MPSNQAEPYQRRLRTGRLLPLTGSGDDKSQEKTGRTDSCEEAPDRQQDDALHGRSGEFHAGWMINRRQMDVLWLAFGA